VKTGQELVVLTKTHDLILWSWHPTGRFPRNHRFVLGERIERNLYDLLETLIRARYTRQRQELLEQANLLLETLQTFWSAALFRRFFSFCRSRLDSPQGRIGWREMSHGETERIAAEERRSPKKSGEKVSPCKTPTKAAG